MINSEKKKSQAGKYVMLKQTNKKNTKENFNFSF